jgi:hypothetical protein
VRLGRTEIEDDIVDVERMSHNCSPGGGRQHLKF